MSQKINSGKDLLQIEANRARGVLGSEKARTCLSIEDENSRLTKNLELEKKKLQVLINAEAKDIENLTQQIERQKLVNDSLERKIGFLNQKIKVVKAKSPDISQILLSVDQKVNDLNSESRTLTLDATTIDELQDKYQIHQFWQLDSMERMQNLSRVMPLFGTFEEFKKKYDFRTDLPDPHLVQIQELQNHFSHFTFAETDGN